VQREEVATMTTAERSVQGKVNWAERLNANRLRKTAGLVVVYVLLIALGVVFVLPLVWMVSTSLKPDSELLAWPPHWIPHTIMWHNYTASWGPYNFNTYLRNTVFITVFAGIGQVFTAAVVAYGFARLRFPGRDFLFTLVLATIMLPGIVTLVPTYIIFHQIGWVDTFYPLIVPSYFGGGAFFIFLFRQFFMTIPIELTDAAKIDGCSDVGIFWSVIMPLAKPGIAAAAIFSFIANWNDFMGPLIYLNSEDKRTITLGLRDFIVVSAQRTQFQYLMAVSTLTVLPVIVIFFVAQKYFIQGVIMSGVKG
jgi:multiple sugar transport system permease protein